jgi:transposase
MLNYLSCITDTTKKSNEYYLPREVIEFDVPEHEKHCACGCIKQRIAEEVTVQLEIIPAQLKVIAYVRPKYACNRCDDGVSMAAMPHLFLPKSMATPGLVAYTLVNKYEDHRPLYCQEKIWQRMGIDMPRNTVCGWIMACSSSIHVYARCAYKRTSKF